MKDIRSKKLTEISEIIKNYDINKDYSSTVKNLQPWQIWLFDFCEKYEIKDSKDIKSLLSLVSKYRRGLEWFRWLEGYLSDYPNLKLPPTGLVFFLFKKAKNEGRFRNVKEYTGNPEAKAYKKLRLQLRSFKKDRFGDSEVTNTELIDEYIKYHNRLVSRYEISERPDANRLRNSHRAIIEFVNKNMSRLLKGSYKDKSKAY